jgi:hypothetical protein
MVWIPSRLEESDSLRDHDRRRTSRVPFRFAFALQTEQLLYIGHSAARFEQFESWHARGKPARNVLADFLIELACL